MLPLIRALMADNTNSVEELKSARALLEMLEVLFMWVQIEVQTKEEWEYVTL